MKIRQPSTAWRARPPDGSAVLLIFLLFWLLECAINGERLCAENVCQHGGICVRGDNDDDVSFRCKCRAGFRGFLCETPMAIPARVVASHTHACEKPCVRGKCEIHADDEAQVCVCEKGYIGDLCTEFDCEGLSCSLTEICLFDIEKGHFACEENICALRVPCKANATCRPAKGDYFCECPANLIGKNCDVIVTSGDERCSRCQNDAKCVRSNANGAIQCECAAGFVGEFCETFVGYCHNNPCGGHGICRELSIGYECSCFSPFHGAKCELIENNRTDNASNKPQEAQEDALRCAHGRPSRFIDGKVGCLCDDNYTGERCDVRVNSSADEFTQPDDAKLTTARLSTTTTSGPRDNTSTEPITSITTCETLKCSRGEICRTRRRFDTNIDTNFEEAECDCAPGLTGADCTLPSAVTLFAESAVLVDRPARAQLRPIVGSGDTMVGDYRLEFSFRTTLATVALAVGESIFGADDFALGLEGGRLRLNFSGTSLPQADFGDLVSLNDAEWHRLRFINTARDGCTIELEDPENGSVTWRRSLGTARPLHRIFTTRFGGKGDKASYFVGCLRDVKIDGQRVDLSAQTRSVGVSLGCIRVEQCGRDTVVATNEDNIAPRCANSGRCVDLWSEFRCDCKRPFLPPLCARFVSEVTFGHKKQKSMAEFSISAEDAELVRDTADVSFFMRTNTAPAVLFYLGERPGDGATFTQAQLLDDGTLEVSVQLGAAPVLRNRTAGRRLDDNSRHFLRVLRSPHNITVFIDDTPSLEIILGRAFRVALIAEILVLGARPRRADSNASEFMDFLRGTLQDVRVNDRYVAIADANGGALTLPDGENFSTTFGRQERADHLLQGTISDDVCAETQPCLNAGRCVNTFNDFRCECSSGWIGARCNERDHCATSPCRTTAACVNVHDGYVCLAPATFAPSSLAIFTLTASSNNSPANFTFELRTRSVAPSAVFQLKAEADILRVDIDEKGALLFTYRNASFSKSVVLNASASNSAINDGNWHAVVISEKNDATHVMLDGIASDDMTLTLPFLLSRFVHRANVSLHFGRNDDERVKSFKGCLQNVRFGALPSLSFFDGVEGAGGFDSNNASTPTPRFALTREENVRAGECASDRVCFENMTNECRNGAVCNDVFNARECVCAPGFIGELCEINADDCAPTLGEPTDAKCGINGICVDGIANYTCECAPGFTGARCDTPAPNECEMRYKNACLNGGKCERDAAGDYKCACPSNFAGQYCQTARDSKCSRAPCKNNATCTSKEDGGFTCDCRAGFAGVLCDVETNADDPCRQRPCLNGGRCVSTPLAPRQRGSVTFPRYSATAFVCECSAEFTGARCERFADACAMVVEGAGRRSETAAALNISAPTRCQNDALCENVFGGRICRCISGWRGADCTVDINECVESMPCLNGARCRNTLGSFECDCPPFYFGEHCEIQGACALQPCRNGAVCEQLSAQHHTCHCAPGYRGESCEEEIDFCAFVPCLNGGTCRRVVAGFECTCTPGYTGKTCETDIDECALAPNACANNGTCIDRINAFECDCTGTGYQGPQCLDDVDECAELAPALPQHGNVAEDYHEELDDNADMESTHTPSLFHPKFAVSTSRGNESSSLLSIHSSTSKCVHGSCTNLLGSYHCDCKPGFIGERCHMTNPCLPEPHTHRVLHACMHGKCVRPMVVRQTNGREVTQHNCDCDPGYGGAQCTFLEQAKKPLAIGFILGPFAILLVILCAFGTMLFLLVVRKKRATQGTYSPSTQEMTGAVRPTLPIHAHANVGATMMTKSANTTQKRISPKPRKTTAASISAHLNNNNGF